MQKILTMKVKFVTSLLVIFLTTQVRGMRSPNDGCKLRNNINQLKTTNCIGGNNSSIRVVKTSKNYQLQLCLNDQCIPSDKKLKMSCKDAFDSLSNSGVHNYNNFIIGKITAW